MGIGTNEIKSQLTVPGFPPLTIAQKILRKRIDTIHPHAVPIGDKPSSHGAHQLIILSFCGHSSFLIFQGIVDDIHHATNSVFRKKYRFFVQLPQRSQGMVGYLSLWNLGVEVYITHLQPIIAYSSSGDRRPAGPLIPQTHSHCPLPGLLTEPILNCPSHRPLPKSTSRVSSSDRTTCNVETASRNTGPSLVSLSMPHITTLGWLRSRNISPRMESSYRFFISGELWSSQLAIVSS